MMTLTELDKEYFSIITYLKNGLEVIKKNSSEAEVEDAVLMKIIIDKYRAKIIEEIKLGNHVSLKDINDLLIAKQSVHDYLIRIEDAEYEQKRMRY